MEETREEIRTPREHLLVFVLERAEGRQLLEVKSRYKTDYIELEEMIRILSELRQVNRITP